MSAKSPYSHVGSKNSLWTNFRQAGPAIVLGVAVMVAATALGVGTAADPSIGAKPPHVVFFLVDDLGWADLGCYGSAFYETPHIDRLAATGMRFTQAYTAGSVCSPTRASIMTGKHPVRIGITDWIPGRGDRGRPLRTPEDRHFLPLEEITIGEVFQEAGYETFYAGKWHLGGWDYAPNRQGFEHYFDPHRDPAGGSPKPLAEGRPHDTRGITREAIGFLEKHAHAGPVFALLSYYDVHTPIVADERFVDRFKARSEGFDERYPIPEHEGMSRSRQDNPAYASMVSAVDESVGQVLGTLNELGIAEDTVVVFFSDNGGLCTLRRPGPTCNLPLRAGKGWLYEGGIRVPLVIRAPGWTTPGSVCADPVISMDLLPTLMQLVGLPLQPERHRDGISLAPLLTGEGELQTRENLFWHYPHYHGSTWTPGAAIRHGPWKLLEFYETGKRELYNLETDPGEARDLGPQYPEKMRELTDLLHTWQDRMEAQLPTPKN